MSAFEKHYTVQEIAKLWRWSQTRVREAFRDEVGIVKHGHPALLGRGHNHPRKQSHYTLTIPESVMVRVYDRMVVKSKGGNSTGQPRHHVMRLSAGEELIERVGQEKWNSMTELERQQAEMRERVRSAK